MSFLIFAVSLNLLLPGGRACPTMNELPPLPASNAANLLAAISSRDWVDVSAPAQNEVDEEEDRVCPDPGNYKETQSESIN
jgi:hypothetical protein